MDPLSTAAAAGAGQLVKSIFGGGNAAPAGPSVSGVGGVSPSLDFGGWTVATGGARASATNSKSAQPDMGDALFNGAGAQSSQLLVFGIVTIAAIVAIKVLKR